MSDKNHSDKTEAHLSNLLPSYKQGNFQSPWHAELFALTLSLHKAGHFSWPEWTQYLGKALKEEHVPEFDLAKEVLDNNIKGDAGDDAYYHAWLGALCALLCDKHPYFLCLLLVYLQIYQWWRVQTVCKIYRNVFCFFLCSHGFFSAQYHCSN